MPSFMVLFDGDVKRSCLLSKVVAPEIDKVEAELELCVSNSDDEDEHNELKNFITLHLIPDSIEIPTSSNDDFDIWIRKKINADKQPSYDVVSAS